MRSILVKIHRSVGKEWCLNWGIMGLLFTVVLLLVLPFIFDWSVFIGMVILGAGSTVLLVARSDDYAEIEPPMFCGVDQYGRTILTNGEKTVLLEETKPKEKRIEIKVNTDRDARNALRMIDAYYREEKISKEDYERVKTWIEGLLRDGTLDKTAFEQKLISDSKADGEIVFAEAPELHEKFCQLKKLYEDDLITEEEYMEKKEQLLDEL